MITGAPETIDGQLDAYAEITVNKQGFEVFRGYVEDYYAVAEGQLVPSSDAGDLAIELDDIPRVEEAQRVLSDLLHRHHNR